MRTTLGILLVVLVGAACDPGSDPLSSEQPFSLTASGPSNLTGSWFQATPSTQVLDCNVPITVQASGSGYADWEGGRRVVQDPDFGAIGVDYTEANLTQIFGSSRIQGGETKVGTFLSRGTETHPVTFALFYRLEGGELRSTSVSLTCRSP